MQPRNEVSPVESVRPPASRVAAVCLVLFVGTLLLFSRALSCDFLDYDDPDYVTRNPHVQGGLNAEAMRWAFTTDAAGNWHPLTWLSHMVDWQLFGSNPRGHHATSIVLHAANAALAFLALRRLTGAFWTSALVAALFAFHPLRVESVAWIAERKDVLSVFFALLALWSYAVYAERRRAGGVHAKYFYALTLATFAAGLLSKAMLVTLPLLLLLLDVWPLRRLGTDLVNWNELRGLAMEKIPFVFLSAGSCVATYFAQKKGGAIVETMPPPDRLENAVVSVAGYLGKILWPFNLAVGYPRPSHWPFVPVFGAALLVCVVTGVALVQWRRRPWLAVGWFWFLIALAPVSGLVPAGLQAMADRYTYLPMLGLLLAALWSLRELQLFSRTPWLVGTASALVIAGLGLRTWNQLAVWRTSAALYEHALAVTKGNYLAHCYLGTTLLNEGRTGEACLHFQRAIELKPDYATAHRHLALAFEKLDRDAEASAAYEALLKFRPDDADAWFRCANVLARMDRDADALARYARAIELRPDFEPAHCNYADSLRALHRFDEACAEYRRALELAPGDANAHYGLAAALEDSGHEDDALASYRRAVELKPAFADAQYNLGVLLLNRNQPKEAIRHFEAVIETRTNYGDAYLGLGLAEAQLNETAAAIRDLERARQLNPNAAGAAEALKQLRDTAAIKTASEHE
jgi:tetratricopeptide (TPR) repeat protein